MFIKPISMLYKPIIYTSTTNENDTIEKMRVTPDRMSINILRPRQLILGNLTRNFLRGCNNNYAHTYDRCEDFGHYVWVMDV